MLKNNLKNKNIIILVVIAIAAALAVAIFLFQPNGLNDDLEGNPNKQLEDSLYATINAWNESHFSPLEIVSDAYYNGTFTVQPANANGDPVSTYNFYQNREIGAFATTYKSDSSTWSWQIRDNKLSLQADTLSGAYGLSLIDIREKLEGANFSKALNTTAYKILESYSVNHFGTKGTQDSFQEQGVRMIFEALASAQVYAENEVISLDGEGTKATTLVYNFDQGTTKEAYAILKAKAKEFNDEYSDYLLNAICKICGDMGCDIPFEEKGASQENIEQFLNQIERLMIHANPMAEVRIALNPRTSTIMQIQLAVTGYVNDTELTTLDIEIVLGESFDKENEITFKAILKSENITFQDTSLSVIYNVEQTNGKTTQELVTDFKDEYKSWRDKISFVYESSKNTFTFFTDISDRETVFDGNVLLLNDSLRATVHHISVEGSESDLSIGLVVTKDCALPDMPAYTDAFTLSETEIRNVYDALKSRLLPGLLSDADTEFDIDVFLNYDSSFDYDGDGDTGDAEDKAMFEIYRQSIMGPE